MIHLLNIPFKFENTALKQGTVFFYFILILNLTAKSQLMELGGHFGYSLTKLTVKENRLSEDIFVKAGRPFNGLSIGAQLMMSPPKKQSTNNFRLVPSILFEATLCRCGGNIELSVTTDNGTRVFRELKYLFYRGDYSAKFVANIKRLQFLIGPTISNRFYTGVRIGVNDELRFAGDHFRKIAVGYEFGVGVKLNRIQLSARYNRTIGPYGKESDLVPTEYGNYQLRFMLHYFFLQKHKGQYWDSIYIK